MKIWSIPFWTVIGVILAAILLIVTVITNNRQNSLMKKNLEVTLLSKTSLINPNTERSREKLKIYYSDQEISDVSIAQFMITNTGGKEIAPEDFEEPIRIKMLAVQRMINVEVISKKPVDLGLIPEIKDDSIEISKALMNPGDQLVIEVAWQPRTVFTIGPEGVAESPLFDVTGRMKGIKSISKNLELAADQKITKGNQVKPTNLFDVILFDLLKAVGVIFLATMFIGYCLAVIMKEVVPLFRQRTNK